MNFRLGLVALAGMFFWSGTVSSARAADSTQPATAAARPALSLTAVAARPADWFKTDQGGQVLVNILSWQAPAGGWVKNYDLAAGRKPGETGDWEGTATIDNNATHTEMRILARAFKATGRKELAESFGKGLDFLLAAQYPNGGWPQRFPPPDNYGSHITFNDDAMTDVMNLLKEIAAGKGDFDFVEAGKREKAGQAFARGVDCILQCQIVSHGKLTGWCAQHDEKTLAPANARAYELPSISGSEGARIALLLMQIAKPDERVRKAVHAAAAWFDAVKIAGKRVEEFRDAQGLRDRRVVDDPAAPPLWGRFYDIDTNQPFFCSRDGIKRASLAEISLERRAGYAWYGNWGAQVQTQYAAWKTRLGSDAAPAQ